MMRPILDEWLEENRLPDNLEEMVRSQIESRGITNQDILRALRSVPRDKFVPAKYQHLAYADQPLPIGFDQTISQPYVVAYMTELLEPSPDDIILEVGTGCGYQTAILCELCRKVYSLEIIPELAKKAEKRLQELKYTNFEIRVGDGHDGWEENAPFQGIIVTAAAKGIPDKLIEQLDLYGRLVIPIGKSTWSQDLMLIQKKKNNRLVKRSVLPVRFVPLVKKEQRKTKNKG